MLIVFTGMLMRKWRPPDAPALDELQVVNQIVLPHCCRNSVISVAHDPPLGGHLGVNKTYHKVLALFYWPKMKRYVSKFCRTCHASQVIGKPNQPIPACEEPFCNVIIDCVDPLSKMKSGNQYLLIIICKATCFPEVLLLSNIKIVDALANSSLLLACPI